MATTLFFRQTAASTGRADNSVKLNGVASGWIPRGLSTTQGSTVTTATMPTVNGATNGIEVAISSIPIEWISEPLDADTTIAGTITFNLRAGETQMADNVAINCIIERMAGDGTLTTILKTTRVVEVSIAAEGVNNFTQAPTSTLVQKGERLRLRVFGDDAGTMSSGGTITFWYDGATGATGDSYITFNETFGFLTTAPTGSQIFLTDDANTLTDAPVLVTDFTGANENPISDGGNWAQTDSAGSPLQRISNAAAGTLAANAFSHWTVQNYGPDLEATILLSTVDAGQGVVVHIVQEGGASTWDGHYGTAYVLGESIARIVDGAVNAFAVNSSAAWNNGDILGLRVRGQSYQLWRKRSGTWTQLLTSCDQTLPPVAGKIGLIASSTTGRIDNLSVSETSNLLTEAAWTSRGSGVVSTLYFTRPGWFPPLAWKDWFTPTLSAFTLSGLAHLVVWVGTGGGGGRVGIRGEVAVTDGDGSNPVIWGAANYNTATSPYGQVQSAMTALTLPISGGDIAVAGGQRLRIRVYADDTHDLAMGDSVNLELRYNVGSATTGDSYLRLAQTVTTGSASPAGGKLMRKHRRAHRFLSMR
jgi:hypothetical protein